jgi:hypothetical protein
MRLSPPPRPRSWVLAYLWTSSVMRIFELGPGRKFRGYTGPTGFLVIEIRTPSSTWAPVTAPDLLAQATNALGLAAVGEPPAGFKFTVDARYVGDSGLELVNPFLCRRG